MGNNGRSSAMDRISPGCVGYSLPDGRMFEFDLIDDHISPKVLMRAAEMAYHRGGGTHPISNYDIRIAREEITGEVNEVSHLQRELHKAQAEIRRLTAEATSDG